MKRKFFHMVKFKLLLTLILFSFYSSNNFAQKRIGFEVSPRFFNVYATIHYQQVFKRNFLFSGGFYFGNFGKGEVSNGNEFIKNGYHTYSPFDDINQPYTDTFGNYELSGYDSNGKGIGIQFGLGFFHEFSVVHGIRINLNSKLGFMDSKFRSYYFNPQNDITHIFRVHKLHFVSAISLEISHTIRVSGRNTLYYGIKLPYYYAPFKKHFNPIYQTDLFYGLEPEIGIGFTHVIGTCD